MMFRLGIFSTFLFLIPSAICSAQSIGPQLIDELNKPNAETASSRFLNAASILDRIADRPKSMLEFLLRRGQDQSIGEAYRRLGIQRAFFAAEHFNLNRFVWTICQADSKPLTQIWLIDSVSQKHSCTPDDISLTATSFFVALSAPNKKYEMGGCCMIDEVGYAASMETLKAFADVIIPRKGATAYLIVYGGTNIFRYREGDGPEKSERHLDSQSFVAKLGKDIRQTLLSGGLDPSRFTLVNGGYRDQYASIDLWIVPPGGTKPIPTPNYFPGKRSLSKSNQHSH